MLFFSGLFHDTDRRNRNLQKPAIVLFENKDKGGNRGNYHHYFLEVS